ncbi:Hsp70 family protein [Virgisporangium aurantiacum]|uniref:Hsp70 family protein n=1 Tax=Virgisporangium aurantiacum TaxID=175570 RepID=UPI0019501B01|nr:Hsp70 family protein [Virgisporangium aurantiacum]
MRTVRLGVDFGTSNTVAVLELPNREPRPLLFDGSPLLPSAVAADAGGHLVVGRDALHTATIDPGAFEPHPKRCIDDETVLLGDRSVPVADLIAAVLHRVAGEAARAAGGAPTDIVLTCPAGWATGRRDLLRHAAATALPDARLVEEPVAAANHFIAVGGDLAVGDTAVVYDFGAGTFDASVIRRTAAGIEVLATEGLNDCGGLDIDAAIVESLGAALGEKPGWSRLVEPKTTADRRASRQLWDNVRQAKEMLSRAATTLVHVPLVDVEVPIGREQLDAAAAPVLDRTVTAVRAALRTAEVPAAGAIFLCGGSSRMPVVTTVLHRAFGIEPTVVDQPELAVAEGSIQSPAAVAAPEPGDPSWPTVDLTKRPAPSSRPFWVDPRVRIGAAAAAVLLAAATVTAFALQGRSDDEQHGAAFAAASASGRASVSPSVSYAAGIDPCLVGTWVQATDVRTNKIDGKDVQFVLVSGRKTATFEADGRTGVVFDQVIGTATVNGNKWEEIVNGWASGRYRAGNGTLIYDSWSVGGTWELRRNGRRNTGGALSISNEAERYVCAGDSLSTGSSFSSETMTRVK